MNKTEKSEMIASVAERIKKSNAMYLIDYSGITVEEVNELRREFRKSMIDYKVFKNTLTKRAIDESQKYDKVKDYLVGMTGLAFGYDDPVAPARIIKKFNEKYKKLSLKACYLESSFYEGSKLDELASLPSKPEIVAGIIGSLTSPISGLVGTINAVLRDLVGVVEAIEQKQQQSN